MDERPGRDGNLKELPSEYERWRSSTLGRITDEIEGKLILDLTGDVAGRTILDVGCGDGAFAVESWKRGAKVVNGVDASPQMIEAAHARARTHGADITFDVGTAQALPFPDNTFDRVVAVTVLCFVDDAAQALREMARVLRPGGRLVVGELGKWSTWAAERRLRGWLGSRVWRRARFRTAHELQHLAKGAGLAVGSLRGAIYYPPCGLAARLLGPVDSRLSRWTTVGAAFVTLAATKPPR